MTKPMSDDGTKVSSYYQIDLGLSELFNCGDVGGCDVLDMAIYQFKSKDAAVKFYEEVFDFAEKLKKGEGSKND
jgi:hypothetical protein